MFNIVKHLFRQPQSAFHLTLVQGSRVIKYLCRQGTSSVTTTCLVPLLLSTWHFLILPFFRFWPNFVAWTSTWTTTHTQTMMETNGHDGVTGFKNVKLCENISNFDLGSQGKKFIFTKNALSPLCCVVYPCNSYVCMSLRPSIILYGLTGQPRVIWGHRSNLDFH